jgi:hypothetical protein
MLLGDLIAQLQDEAVVSETLLSLGDLALASRFAAIAAASNVSVGELAAQKIGRFVSTASDEDWLTLIGQMSRAENPGQVFLRRALSNAGRPCETGSPEPSATE